MEIPYEKTMVEIFRWRVDRSGNDIAHKFEEKETTFKQLDSFSNKAAFLSIVVCNSSLIFVFDNKTTLQLRLAEQIF